MSCSERFWPQMSKNVMLTNSSVGRFSCSWTWLFERESVQYSCSWAWLANMIFHVRQCQQKAISCSPIMLRKKTFNRSPIFEHVYVREHEPRVGVVRLEILWQAANWSNWFVQWKSLVLPLCSFWSCLGVGNSWAGNHLFLIFAAPIWWGPLFCGSAYSALLPG